MTPRAPRIGSLCSGYGGLTAAVHAVLGGELAWYAQHDPADKHQYAARIMAHHFPGIPNHGDITTCDWSAVEPIDVLEAGFPCQPVSNAGKRKGTDDERWLWPDVARAVRELRPRLVVLENVAALLGRGMPGVLGDLAALGFDAEWVTLRASDVGAPHQRARVFILAWPSVALGVGSNPESDRRGEGRPEPARLLGRPDAALSGGAAPADTDGGPLRLEPVAEPRSGRATVAGLAGSGAAAHPGRDPRAQDDPDRTPTARCRRCATADPSSLAEREPADGTHTITGSRDPRAEPRGRSLPDRERERGRRRDQAAADTQDDGRERSRNPRGRRQGPAHGGPEPDLDWGPYTPAVRRWQAVVGRAAPVPTEPGRNGPRLAPALPEWMMGLPLGWVTDVPEIPRNAQLKAIGNGVVPQQGAAALRILLDRMETR